MKEALLEGLLRQMRLRRTLPTIKAFKEPSVLDIGCGWEVRLLREIEPYIARGVGIDFKAPHISTEKLEVFPYYFESKQTSRSPAAAGGGGQLNNWENASYLGYCKLPFKDSEFDVVCLLAVLEHLNYPFDMMQEIARVLKPKGVAILTVPSHLAKPVLEFLSFKLKIVSEDEIADHKRYYNKKDLLSLSANLNTLKLAKHKYFQCGMNNFALFEKQ